MRILQGIDLLKVDRIEKIYLNYGESFLKIFFQTMRLVKLKKRKKKN